MLGVEREQAWIEFGEAARAGRAGALGREYGLRQRQFDARALGFFRRVGEAVESAEHVHDALAEVERALERRAQVRFVRRRDAHVGHRQLYRVFAEAVQARPFRRRQELAVDAQEIVALALGPFGEIGVVALAAGHQRREQADALAAIVFL